MDTRNRTFGSNLLRATGVLEFLGMDLSDLSDSRIEHSVYALLVPKSEVNNVKSRLKSQNLLNEDLKIAKPPESAGNSQDHLLIRTNLPCEDEHHLGRSETNALDGLKELRYPITVHRRRASHARDFDRLRNGVRESLECLPVEFVNSIDIQFSNLLLELRSSYCVYKPLLLLAASAVAHEDWQNFLLALTANRSAQDAFFSRLARRMDVTHVAIDGPVPSQLPRSANGPTSETAENLIRSPTNLRPLYGDFGPALSPFPEYVPDGSDFEKAFWISTKQNGITQIWAPRFTMFSSGNVTEKSRLLRLDSVRAAVEHGCKTGKGCAAVDMFAGIGYFAFSYAKAGFDQVLCWDLNPWSVEGMRRGCLANKWQYSILSGYAADTPSARGIGSLRDDLANARSVTSPKFTIFNESNERAIDRIRLLKDQLPPIRHVNCGMLPTSSAAWKTAICALDENLGGWLHLHETVLLEDIDARVSSIVDEITVFAQQLRNTESSTIRVILERVKKVKTAGPRLLHIVLDIAALKA